MPERMTIAALRGKKERRQPITMLTAYTYPQACLIDAAGIDVILVGDSVAMTEQGLSSTIPVTMEEMLYHATLVRRGVERALVIGDMPYAASRAGLDETVQNAERFVKEAGCDGVKLEGGSEMAETVRAIVAAGVPVQGHIGLTPQSASSLGGFKVQGKDAEAALKLVVSARDLESAGAFSILLECVPAPVAALITERVSVPTIGIGAGPACDGQVLVFHDMVGLFDRFIPKFVKRYADLKSVITDAVTAYRQEVETGVFPAEEHIYHMDPRELAKLKESLQ